MDVLSNHRAQFSHLILQASNDILILRYLVLDALCILLDVSLDILGSIGIL